MSLLNTLSFLLNHPLSQDRKLATLRRFVAWQIGARLVPGPVVCPFANGSWLLARPGLTGRFDNSWNWVTLAITNSAATACGSCGLISAPRTLSPEGNPELRSLTAILKAMGLRLAVQPLHHA